MMTTARKSFLFSLMFHTLMGSLAFFVLVQMRTPPPMVKIPLQHMMIVSLSHSEPVVKQPKISEPIPVVTPQQPIQKPTVTQPIIPMKPVVSAVQTVATPIPLSSTPPVVQHTVQSLPTPIVTASKPKIDVASEKRAFFSSLRSNIQRNLRYPTSARRRGMEGEVGVRFTLSSNGEINGISVQRGDGIFHNAAIAAVNAASGIDIPKNLIDSLPMEIDLTLEFNLNS
ncbi:TonB family protein [Sulfuricurvum sp.]|uniref:TonB family protein n=1 Tax=Sulfuricurvum sp. TaxID=2025608 RepID=UPI002E30E2A3|nr:TonB family protein [Sulfuricurvum sp.]HEX5328876.1 TonB family protein [Sulfuricurvum sp.]